MYLIYTMIIGIPFFLVIVMPIVQTLINILPWTMAQNKSLCH